ncbi:MAG TPA: hypothetical protein VMN36_01940 [Verrucomicrobiales bacterium]|nr:hypothetical protein [Verrucomicrobiales bacterium]
MPVAALTIGILLIVTGIVPYAMSAGGSKTALIPAYIGVVFLLGGGISLKAAGLRKHLMHLLAALALLLGLATAAMGFPNLVRILSGTEVERPMAAWSQSTTALLLFVFLGLAIRSFAAARRARLYAAGQGD